MIEIKDIVKSYAQEKGRAAAVNHVSLTIRDGEIFGIIGYSGAGKSTLVRLINQLEKQDSGDVLIDGKSMSGLSERELNTRRQKIGMIFQHFNLLWSRDVEKNIELPLELAGVAKEKRREKAKELIRLVGLEGKEHSYPSELSGGQKQRVGIARALANDPDILLCDEATSALDPDTTDQILSLIRQINRELKITVVMITHQMEAVQKICDRVAVMEAGEIVELNTVKNLFEHPVHPVTKRFVQNVKSGMTIEQLALSLKSRFEESSVLRLSFTANNADEPVIANAIRSVSFPVSIVDSRITDSPMGEFGVTYLHLYGGTDDEYNHFVTELVNRGVKVEVL